MRKTKVKRFNKGITLIALVITIIVMLILAGVSIAMLTGENGVLKQANDAKTETKLAEIEEKIKLDIMNAKIQLYSNGIQPTISNIANILKEDEFYTDISNDENKIEIKKESFIFKVDKELQVFARNENQPDLKIGDFVDYTATTIENYEVESNVTGYANSQFFSTEENIKWRVLSIDKDVVTLISSTALHQGELNMDGAIGYNNATETLNTICRNLYSNPSKNIYAESVTGEQIERVLGTINWDEEWKAKKENYGEKYNVSAYGEKNRVPDIITKQTNELGYSNPTNLELISNYKLITFTETPNFVMDSNDPIFQLLFIQGNYWIATRYVDAYPEYAGFKVGVASGTAIASNNLFITNDELSGTNNPYGIRPIVKVPFSTIIQKESENGDIDNPYSLNL